MKEFLIGFDGTSVSTLSKPMHIRGVPAVQVLYSDGSVAAAVDAGARAAGVPVAPGPVFQPYITEPPVRILTAPAPELPGAPGALPLPAGAPPLPVPQLPVIMPLPTLPGLPGAPTPSVPVDAAATSAAPPPSGTAEAPVPVSSYAGLRPGATASPQVPPPLPSDPCYFLAHLHLPINKWESSSTNKWESSVSKSTWPWGAHLVCFPFSAD